MIDKEEINYTNLLSLANFVGRVVGFLNVLVIRLRSLLLAAALSFESEMVLTHKRALLFFPRPTLKVPTKSYPILSTLW